jgi:hypothetical protein
MNTLLSCACGHTLEFHLNAEGCSRCECRQDRTSALEALIDALQTEPPPRRAPRRRSSTTTSPLRLVG